MNYTLKELQQRVNQLIENQGEDAHCGAWIYTKNDCHLKDEDGEIDYKICERSSYMSVSSMMLATSITSIR